MRTCGTGVGVAVGMGVDVAVGDAVCVGVSDEVGEAVGVVGGLMKLIFVRLQPTTINPSSRHARIAFFIKRTIHGTGSSVKYGSIILVPCQSML
jgi:hypothetical protein